MPDIAAYSNHVQDVHELVASEGPIKSDDLYRESPYAKETVKKAIAELDEIDVVRSIPQPGDQRQQIYFITD